MPGSLLKYNKADTTPHFIQSVRNPKSNYSKSLQKLVDARKIWKDEMSPAAAG
jgi:hypothetical protein